MVFFHKAITELLSRTPHISVLQLMCSSQKQQKKAKNQKPNVIQCQTFTTWNEVIYLFLLATQKLVLFLSLTMI